MNNNQNLSRNLHDLSEVQPSAEVTQRAVQRAQAALKDQPIEPVSRSGAKLMRPRNLASLAAAVMVLFLLTYFLNPFGTAGGIAFAQVQAQVEKTKSVQYVQTRRNSTKEGLKGPMTEERFMVLGAIQRKETSVIEEGDKLPEGHFWGAPTEKIIDIYDPEHGKLLMIVPEKKGYAYSTEFYSVTEDHEIKTDKIKPVKIPFYEMIRQVPSEKANKLPAKTIDGKNAVGFLVEEKNEGKSGIDTWKRTYWVDQKTNLPIRIEVSFHSTSPMGGESNWIVKDIIFDAPLDPKLFSLDPPAGYKDLAKLEEKSPQQQLGANGLVKAIVFAEAVAALQAELNKAKSLQYTLSWTQSLPDGKTYPTIVQQTKILGDQLKRTEMIDIKPGTIEANFSGPFGRSIEITDLQKKKKASLYPEVNGYMVMDWQGTFADAYVLSKEEAAKLEKKLEEQKAARAKAEAAAKKNGASGDSKVTGYTGTAFVAGKSSLVGAKPYALSDVFELILHVPTDKAKQLPAKKIGDQEVIGFQVDQQETHKDMTANWQHTWWVDAKTNLPVQLKIRYNSKFVQDEKIISDIVFDTPMDPALFSIDMPAGYVDLNKVMAQSQRADRDPNAPPTLRFTQVENLTTKDGKQAPELIKQVTIWGSDLRREDVSLQGEENKQLSVTKEIRPHIRVDDLKQHKAIVLFPDKKEFLDPKTTTFISDYDAIATQASSNGNRPKLDIYGTLQLAIKDFKRLPIQTIDGKLAIGYIFEKQFKRESATDTWTRTQWRDVFSTRDIRIDVTFRSTDPSIPDVDWTMRDFAEGVAVAPDFFSLEPPEGYKNVGAQSKPDGTDLKSGKTR